MKGLKELVEESMGEFAPVSPPPVQMSGEAVRALSHKMRQWSGWSDMTLTFGNPRDKGADSTYGCTCHTDREFVINADALVLNPNRVLLTVTPFRLKQEAVMTGVMLHEAGHARHSLWKPRTSQALAEFKHSKDSIHDGEVVSKQTLAFATMMEEPRIEGFIAKFADEIGASGLTWTMRAATAVLLPMTQLSSDPDQQIMDVINSFVLRAGKQVGVAQWTDHPLPPWVGKFQTFVHEAITNHCVNENGDDANRAQIVASKVISWITLMILCPDDTGTYMVDTSRDVLDLLYPNGSDAAPRQGGCQDGAGETHPAPSAGQKTGDEGQDGQGDSDTSDPGEGTEPGAGDAGQDGQDEGVSGNPADAALAEALSKMEATAKDAQVAEASDTSEKMEEPGGMLGGKGPGTTDARGYRVPLPSEREVKKGAEQFLRRLIDPTESSKILLSDQPSSAIDAARYAAWRADGGTRDPLFFRRTRRSNEPAPPVDIAVLVDISSSMSRLQKPSALLSWALASAATDLRNFAGRGVQVRSTLIHWGDDVRVIVKPSETVPGLKEYDCNQGTSAMGAALATVEDLMPGFFDYTGAPSNRLLVHFTDWELFGNLRDEQEYTARALAAGVNILSVVPEGYSTRRTKMGRVMETARIQRGRNSLMKYNSSRPGQVWDEASRLLNMGDEPDYTGSF